LALVKTHKHAPPRTSPDARAGTGKHAHRLPPATDTNRHAAPTTRVDTWQRRTEAAPCSHTAVPTTPTPAEKHRDDRRGVEERERRDCHLGVG